METKQETLLDIHRATGWSWYTGAFKLRPLLRREMYAHTSYKHLIEHGTTDIEKIEALAVLFGRTAADVRAAAKASQPTHLQSVV